MPVPPPVVIDVVADFVGVPALRPPGNLNQRVVFAPLLVVDPDSGQVLIDAVARPGGPRVRIPLDLVRAVRPARLDPVGRAV